MADEIIPETEVTPDLAALDAGEWRPEGFDEDGPPADDDSAWEPTDELNVPDNIDDSAEVADEPDAGDRHVDIATDTETGAQLEIDGMGKDGDD
jgi:hypothetical protein